MLLIDFRKYRNCLAANNRKISKIFVQISAVEILSISAVKAGGI
jgi:hypothetical protein